MKGSIVLPKEFSQRAEAAVNLIRKYSFIRVISHHDADGIAAAGVMIASLKRAGIDFQITITKSLDIEMVQQIAQETNECAIFLDMGSGQIEGLEALEGDVLVLDHHRPIRDSEKVLQVNPHFFGLDGMKEASASSLSFIVSEMMDDASWESAPIAIAGVIGDMQHLNGYSSINSEIVDGAVKRKLISKDRGLRISGENLQNMISNSIDPYLRGLSGNEDGTIEFLEKAKFEADTKYADLRDGDRRRLISLLTLRLLWQGCNSETIQEISGDLLTISANGLRVDDLTQLLNACGRSNHSGIGLALCLGDLQALQEATRFRTDYERALRSALCRIEGGEIESLENIQIIRPSSPPLAGAICGISMQYLLDQNKPTIALSKSEGAVRVSARATRALVRAGIDLSESLKQSATPIGGTGGGHNIAAGATLPLAREEEFLKNLNEITANQLRNAQKGA